ncbi:MAG: fibrinogen-like YCDxxxxGGGW domain-containing protein [Polyangiaceae bacterium]
MKVHVATADWSEGSVTWASFAGAYSAGEIGEISTCQQPSVLDVTAPVVGWHASAATNFGFALTQGPSAATAFRSSEAAALTDRPALRVCYLIPDCQPGTGDCDGDPSNGCETDTLASATSCGSCGNSCGFANAGASCVAGVCEIGACEPGFVDCNGNPLDGCEAALDTDGENCGACGNTCDNPHGTSTCVGGACVASCADNYGTCDGDEQNGCETPLTSVQNCGGCGQDCALPNANVTCQTGVCDVVSCTNDFGNCDNDPSNGCEAPLNTLQNCGGCGKACAIQNATATCQTGICKLGTCDAEYDNCDAVPYNGCESHLLTDVSHCGNCATACTNAHGTTSCNAGLCDPVCVGLWDSCDNNVKNGCETALNTVSNCGACGAKCLFANGSGVCPTGVCQFSACNTGFGSCDGDEQNGCETPLNTLTDCGSCGNACNLAANAASMTCASLSCKVATCELGRADCDLAAGNGCEVDTLADAQNCGGCGFKCSNAHGSTTCDAGACVPACAAGYADCDGDPTNGCETNTKYTCGTCDPAGTSCRDVLAKDATATTDVYVIDPDGAGPEEARATLCEMALDGGGWTAMFVGKNGQLNGFDRFDAGYHTGNFQDPTEQLLHRKPPAYGGGTELLVTCGAAAVKFPMTRAADDYFALGTQGNWLTIAPTVVAGTITNVPNRLYSGSGSNAGFVFTKDQNASFTFASSYPASASYNRCNSVTDTTSPVRVYYREPAVTCAPDTADCDADPSNGCETNVALTAGSCAPAGRSCAAILAANPGAPSGGYRVDLDGDGPRGAETVYCDMTTDGGGWTAMFVGVNGRVNAFDRFDSGAYAGTFADATGRYLRRKPLFSDAAGTELAVECGGAMVKFPMTQPAEEFFGAGKQQSWVALAPTVIAGTVTDPPNGVWTGSGTNRGFMFAKDQTATLTFASSYGNSTSYDRCNSVTDTTSTVRVYFREPVASACAAGTADCNGDPTDGCETNVSFTGGQCVPAGRSCRDILDKHPGAPTGSYLVELDGAGAKEPLPVYCDMTTDGGGWTAVFVGINGSTNVFDRFDAPAHIGASKVPGSRFLQRKVPWSSIAGAELSVECGAARVKFPLTAAADAYFASGTQASWQSLPGGVVLAGSVPNLPNALFTGSGSTYGFAFARNNSSTQTFASIYPSTSFNRCNSVTDTTSTVRVYVREPAAPVCAAGTSDCDGDPTNGCETDDAFTLGACQGDRSCREILRKHPGAASGLYLVDADGAGPAPGVRAYCDMATDGGGYTMVRVNDVTLATDPTAYAARCAALGMQVIVPQTKAHAQAIYTFNGDVAANLVNVFPKNNGASTLRNWVGICGGGPCPFWISDKADGTTCNSTEPNGSGQMQSRLYRTNVGCGIEGTWADTANTLSIQDWVLCSTNDKLRSAPAETNGFADCDGDASNGCEASLASVTSCGACGNECPSQNGQPACTAGVCTIAACGAGFGDCDGQIGTGCETDVLTDVAHCGACGNVCPGGDHATATCAGGACDQLCDLGFDDCDGSPATGCEADLTSVGSCGACGAVCAVANGTPTCATGSCQIDACDAGFDDCDNDASNGCETDLAADDDNCGACAFSCGGLPNAAGVCQSGSCAYACDAGFGDCDGDPVNGCETAGGCNLSCGAGTGDCDGIAANGCETALTTQGNCGGCGVTCAGAPNAAPVCLGGACAIACAPGFGDCDGDASNGCESSLADSVTSCGACGVVCSAPNAQSACVAGQCAVGACDYGHGDCDGDPANGCETSVLADDANCGGCGISCNGTCTNGTCAGSGCENPNGCAGNDPPQITSSPPTTATEGVAWYYAASGFDPTGSPITWSLEQGPAGMTVDAETGLAQWTPGPTSAGTVPVAIRATDDGGAYFTQAFAVAVTGVNTAPVLVSNPPLIAMAGALYAYPATALDPDNATLAWSVTGPAGMTVSSAGLVLWNVPAGAAGNFPVSLSVSDGASTATQTFSLGVGAAGDATAPTVTITSPLADATVTETIDITGTITDAALQGYTVYACRHWVQGGSDCSVIKHGFEPVTAGVLATFDPGTLLNGQWDIVVQAKDAAGNTTTKTVPVSVEGTVKPGALRLSFTDLTIRTATAELSLNRVYDSLDLAKGETGYGWRYEWHMGHLERPKEIAPGWHSYVCGGFIPEICVASDYEHPTRFHLADGRMYEFLIEVEASGALSSIHDVRPSYTELTATGATLKTLNASFVPYSTVNYDLYEISGVIYEDFDFTEWEPKYYELTTEIGEVITFRTSDFEVVKLKEPNGGVSIDLTGPNMKLDGQNSIQFSYNASGLITKAADLATGAQVLYSYDGSNDLVSVTAADGTTDTFTYVSGHRLLSYQIQGRNPRTYTYTDTGRVSKIVHPDGTIEDFAYDDDSRVVTKKDAGGNTVTMAYDAQGRVLSTTDPLGRTVSFTYAGAAPGPVTETDPLGHTKTYAYDARGRRTSTTDALGHTTITKFDASDRVLEFTDGAGRLFKETVDAQGRPASFVSPSGQVLRTYSYPGGDTTVSTDALGNVETTKFDAKARITMRQDGNGAVSLISYDDVLRSQTVTHADGTTSTSELDPLGRPKKLTLSTGEVFEYKYGPDQEVSELTRPDGAVLKYERNAKGQLTEVTLDGAPLEQYGFDALGRRTMESTVGGFKLYEYDAAGQVTAITTEAGAITLSYDAAGRIIGRQSDSGSSVTLEYDDADRITAVEDSDGNRKELTYDASGRPLTYVDPIGRTTAIQWDADGRMAKATFPDGRTNEWTYEPTDAEPGAEDELVASFKDIEGVSWTFGHDGDGNIEAITDALGNTASFVYDDARHITTVIDPAGHTTAMSWGPNGLDTRTAPSGKVSSWAYSAGGELASWTREDSSAVNYTYSTNTVAAALPGGEVHVVVDDPETGMVMTSGASGGGVTEEREAGSQIRTLTRADGASVTLDRTPEGEVETVTASLPGGQVLTSSATYDAGGHMASLTGPNGETTTFGYDAAGRVTAASYPNGASIEVHYAAHDRPSHVHHMQGAVTLADHDYEYSADGKLTKETSGAGERGYAYDALGRLTQVQELNGAVVLSTTTYAYDAAGNLTAQTDAAGSTTFTYDADDQLVSASGPAGTTTYTYTGRGALHTVAAPSGTTTYDYDDLDRLTKVTLPGGDEVTYLYDVAGRLLARIDASGERRFLPLPSRHDDAEDWAVSYDPGGGNATMYTFGPLGIAGVFGPSGARYAMTADRGSVTGWTDAAGALAGERAYDAWGGIAQATGFASEHGYLGERQDAATGLVYLRARWYDPATKRFLTPDRAEASTDDSRSLNRYVYGADDPTNKEDRAGEFFSLGGMMAAINIQSTLQTINHASKVCISRKMIKKLFVAVAGFAAGQVVSYFAGNFLNATVLKNLKGEYKLQQLLSQILCNDISITNIVFGDIDFEVRTDGCGVPEGGKANGQLKCADKTRARRGLNGIDVVYGKKLPIELKVGPKKPDLSQLKRWCRFSSGHSHVFVTAYIYAYLPSPDINDKMADECWTCWKNVTGCSNKPPFGVGAVYVGVGLVKGNRKGRIYVADPTPNCLP